MSNFNVAEIRAMLSEQLPEVSICVLDTVDSTNTEAKRQAVGGNKETVLIVARSQSAGRGRMGREFYSPCDTGAYFSLLYTPDVSHSEAVTVTCAASVAVMRAIRTLTGREAGIKWVNDLYLDGKKVCGILCESVVTDGALRLIVGIGINVTTSFAGSGLEEIAGALGGDGESADPTLGTRLIAETVKELLPMLAHPEERTWLFDYRSRSLVTGRRIRFLCNGVAEEGIALEIDGDGALIVQRDSGETVRLFSGKITVRMQ